MTSAKCFYYTEIPYQDLMIHFKYGFDFWALFFIPLYYSSLPRTMAGTTIAYTLFKPTVSTAFKLCFNLHLMHSKLSILQCCADMCPWSASKWLWMQAVTVVSSQAVGEQECLHASACSPWRFPRITTHSLTVHPTLLPPLTKQFGMAEDHCLVQMFQKALQNEALKGCWVFLRNISEVILWVGTLVRSLYEVLNGTSVLSHIHFYFLQ